jgi:hypothetical protein
MLMLKIARIVGMTLLLPLLLVACNPAGFFGTQAYNDQPTPTPRSYTAAQTASLIRTQLVETQGLPVEVMAGGEGELVVQYPAGTQDESTLLGSISRTIGGFAELNYTSVYTVTMVPMTNGQPGEALTTNTDEINAWYQREISGSEYMNMLTGAEMMPETEVVTSTEVMTGTTQ